MVILIQSYLSFAGFIADRNDFGLFLAPYFESFVFIRKAFIFVLIVSFLFVKRICLWRKTETLCCFLLYFFLDLFSFLWDPSTVGNVVGSFTAGFCIISAL